MTPTDSNYLTMMVRTAVTNPVRNLVLLDTSIHVRRNKTERSIMRPQAYAAQNTFQHSTERTRSMSELHSTIMPSLMLSGILNYQEYRLDLPA